ncbi:MAG: phosphotransferase enzyme family protein [Candidatus Methylomirabilales bacterium]
MARQFDVPGEVREVVPHGSGNINQTFLVSLQGGAQRHVILQRMNATVFRRPDLVMRNIRVVTEHTQERLAAGPWLAGRWEMPRIVRTRDGGDFFTAPDGSAWRALSCVENARTVDTITGLDHAREVGRALGTFHSLIADLPGDRLADTLPGFHVTPGYLRHYDEVVAEGGVARSPEIEHGLRFIAARRGWASVLEDAREQGRLHCRPIHGDPKVNNVMLDEATGRAVSLIDLDTVKPGLLHYDLGDCLRSCCNPAGEDAARLADVRFEPDICRAILQGYLPLAKGFLTDADSAYLYDAVRLIAFELGLRFFTDHLAGDVYFRVRARGHNLARAMVQFALTESIEARAREIEMLVRELR